MCGLNGIFAYHGAAGSPSRSELLATRDAMLRRGPDGAGQWWTANGRCALAHRRLAILDLNDRALQPMISADGQLAIVFNGEIYNYPLLRRELEKAGVQFRTNSDTEALLHLYAREGFAMVSRLRGMFAFAIWDENKRGLFIARDVYGMKPLYTACDGWTFRFASQVKAIIDGGRVSSDPDPAGVVGFNLFGHVPEPFTIHRHIRALPAGHTQWVDAAGPREPVAFSSLAAIVADAARVPVGVDELGGRLREGLRESVRAHLLADVEVGLFLSAGVDSGALLGVMRDVGQQDVHAVTLAFDEFRGSANDESPLATQVANQYRARQSLFHISEQEFRADLPLIFDAMDQPSIDGVNTWFVAKAAKRVGLKVALSGLGGDELLAGYPSFRNLPQWRRRFGSLAALPGLGRLARIVVRALMPSLSGVRPKALGLLQYANSWAGLYLLQRGLFLPHELDALMDPAFLKEGLARLRPLQRLAASLKPDPESDMARVAVLESANYMRNQLLRDADWAGMAHGVEIRAPFVDVPLLKVVAPVFKALRPGEGKAALAGVSSLPLPEEVVMRGKTGFCVPTGAWLAREAAAARRSHDQPISAGLVSRQWSQYVLSALAPSRVAPVH
jgi:asparagine synthase (glutamine-hydrolysing)